MNNKSEHPSPLSNDMLDLLSIFNSHNVEFFIVGGHAVSSHIEPRATKDLDILINPSIENAKRVYAALSEFGAPISELKVEDFCDEENFYIIGVKPNRIDILMKIPGLNFDSAWLRKIEVILGKTTAYIPHIEDLITSKKAAGRPQDLLDVIELEKSLNRKR